MRETNSLLEPPIPNLDIKTCLIIMDLEIGLMTPFHYHVHFIYLHLPDNKSDFYASLAKFLIFCIKGLCHGMYCCRWSRKIEINAGKNSFNLIFGTKEKKKEP